MFRWWHCLFIISIVACSNQSSFVPRPTYFQHNADFTPIIREFDGVEMVFVPAGCFTMGHENGRRDEVPEHQICFDAPFWIDRYEVSNAQYGSSGAFQEPNHPRENITWFEARDHCLSRGARLPTEAEWEYAARGPDSWLYPWGNELDYSRVTFDGNFNSQTVPVNSHPDGASWVGAYNMIGNVWEWTSSLYAPYPYNPNDGREDLNNTTDRRVYRGGLGSYIDYGMTASARFRADPNTRDWFIGFRCARSQQH
ncbi:MAG: hypothetical protein CUN55_13055 [Phototrophicales bacterium]|nr:MAG: hypothetical protein CUN55_13055 [Phototrophicales bacterium]